jgi:hypothetical protein
MAYRIERKKYKPVMNRAENMLEEGIGLSRRGNLLLVYPEDLEAKLECVLGWENEKVTHLILQPNNRLSNFIAENKEEVHSWIDTKLTTLFDDIPVPYWKI